MNNDKEQIKQQNKIRFIEAAQQLIDAEGLEAVSIRKIAEKAGFHNSTIYLYFKDVDELILFASLKYFNEYNKALSELSTRHLSEREQFLSIWDFFAQTVFKKPKVFYNFFFGRHSHDLTDILQQYYTIFPAEREKHSKEIEEMYYGKDIHARCMQEMKMLTDFTSKNDEETITMVNDIIVGHLKYLLEEKCQNPALDSDILTERLLKVVEFVTK